MDKTKTPMGGRLLRKWLDQPLISLSDILPRQDAIAQAKESFILRQELLEAISGLHDLERLTSRIALGQVNARDLLMLRNSLMKLPPIIDLSKRLTEGLFQNIHVQLDPLYDISSLLASCRGLGLLPLGGNFCFHLDDQFCQFLFAFFLAVGVDISCEAASIGEPRGVPSFPQVFVDLADAAGAGFTALTFVGPEGGWSRFPWRCVYILADF